LVGQNNQESALPETVGLGTRCMAAMIDYTLLLGVSTVIIFLIAQFTQSPGLTDQWTTTSYFTALLTIITFYHLFFELAWHGQTPGKLRLGLRVVQTNGLPATTGAIIIRNLFRLIDFLPICYGVGLITLFVTPRTQRLGDLAAQTIIIRQADSEKPSSPPNSLNVEYIHIRRHSPLPPDIDITNLTIDDRRAIVSYLQRRPELGDNRAHLANILVRRIAERMNLGHNRKLDSVESAETLLEHTARAFEIWQKLSADDSNPADP
jgi:uncharacterized RDD family membrane protein YckC